MDYDMKIFQACTNLDPLPTLDSLLDLRSVYLPCNAVNSLSVALNVCNGLIYLDTCICSQETAEG